MDDVTTRPVLSNAVNHTVLDFEMSEHATYRDLAVADGASRYFHFRRSAEDLLARSAMTEASTPRARPSCC